MGLPSAVWEERLRSLPPIEIHGHCNVPINCKEPSWEFGSKPKDQYKLQEGKRHRIWPPVLELEAWVSNGTARAAWEERLSELAEYRKIHGHCNVPQRYSKTSSWDWVKTKGPLSGCTRRKKSPLTTSYPGIESLGFSELLSGLPRTSNATEKTTTRPTATISNQLRTVSMASR
jgi:hypothetical protein